jgi:hypothetical protein
MTPVRYTAGQKVTFSFDGGEYTGTVDAHGHQGFVIVKDSDVPKRPLIAVRETKVSLAQ